MRYSDKPLEIFKESLSEYLDNEWHASQKLDGWKTFIVKDKNHTIINSYKGNKEWAKGKNNDLFFLSRRDKNKGGPTEIPVKQEIIDTIESLDLPDCSFLDVEWMARRTIGECPEKVYFVDILWLNDEWLGNKPFKERYEIALKLVGNKFNEHFELPKVVTANYLGFFEEQTKIPYTEGIVLKHLQSTIIGDTAGCKKNPLLSKLKWRSGADGRDLVT